MMSLGKTIDELAAEIASSKYFKTIFPGKKEIIQEFNETFNKNQKFKTSLKDNEIAICPKCSEKERGVF